MTTTDLHPLIGRWSGSGRGTYPTIAAFAYLETITISLSSKGFLVYHQATNHPETGAPMHAEMGYLRPGTDGSAELLLVQPNGVAELHTGRVLADADAWTVTFRSTTIGRTETAKLVESVERRITIVGDVLSYELDMAAVGEPQQFHLAAELRRDS